MRAFPSTAAVLALVGLPVPLWGEVEGRVTDPSGAPVSEARVAPLEDDREEPSPGHGTLTDRAGRFRLEEVEPPAVLAVSHPSFETAQVPVTGSSVEITLEPRATLSERIVVAAEVGGSGRASPAVIAAASVAPERLIEPPSSLTEMAREVPGVSENGQGGLFQVVSIRGISGQRILALLSGMRLTSERRAGVAASFLDPLLMSSVEVLRGPASSYFGSGALGGVVEVVPRRFEALAVASGYETAGGESYLAAGWGRPGPDGLSLGLARRRAGSTRTPDGMLRPSGFEQTSATVRKHWRAGERSWELLAIPAAGRDIGKPNTDFPQRTTTYPREDHLLVKLSTVAERGWRAHLFAHPQELETETVRLGGERETVDNRSFDFGFGLERELAPGKSLAGRLGLDYFGRRDADAVEHRSRPGEPPEPPRTTLENGREDEAALYGSLRFARGRTAFEAGGRWTRLRQATAGSPALSRSAWSGFAGVLVALPRGLELTANAGTGLRFPTLSERFFTGTTGRGEVVANTDLAPERSLSADVGLRWAGDRLSVAGHLFRNRIRDYIEQVELEPDISTFVNLTSGTLEGLELEASARLDRSWRLALGGHLLSGRDEKGGRLADVPPSRLAATLRYEPPVRRWEAALRGEVRGSIRRPGSGEKPIPSAVLLGASVGFRLRPGLELTLSGRNLLDREYFASADRKAVPEPGRSLGVGLAWGVR